MIIGPYTSKIERSLDIEIDGIKQMHSDYFPKPDDDLTSLARFDLGIEKTTEHRSSYGGKINVDWSLEIKEARYGIYSMSVIVDRVYGYIEIEDLPTNSLGEDPDEDLEEFEIEFDSKDKSKGEWNITVEDNLGGTNYYGDDERAPFKLTNGFEIGEVSIDFKDNTIIVYIN